MGTPSQSYGTSFTCHYIITHSQCYLPPDTSERALPNPSHAGWYSIYLPRRHERLSWPSWLDSAPPGSRTSDLSITTPTPNRCTTKTTKIKLDYSISWDQYCKLLRPIKLIASSKYCRRFWMPLSDAGNRRYFTPSDSKWRGTCDVTFITWLIRCSLSRLRLAASWSLPSNTAVSHYITDLVLAS